MASPPLVFVDTNVFLYAVDSSEGDKQVRAQEWLDGLWARRLGRTSSQVLNEFYVNLVRKLRAPRTLADCRRHVDALAAWDPVPLTPSITTLAWAVEDLYGFSWWDSLIVAAARHAACDVLLTEDLQHGQKLEEMEVVDPFRRAPEEVFGGLARIIHERP